MSHLLGLDAPSLEGVILLLVLLIAIAMVAQDGLDLVLAVFGANQTCGKVIVGC